MGLDHSGPDEFDVTPLAPLSLPKDFNKTPSNEKIEQQASENAANQADSVKETKEKSQSPAAKPETKDTAEIQTAGINTLAHESFEATHILIGSKGDTSAKTDPSVRIMLEETDSKPATVPTPLQQDATKQDSNKPSAPAQMILMEETSASTPPETPSLPKQTVRKTIKKLESHPILQQSNELLPETEATKEDDLALTPKDEKLTSHKWTQLPDKEIQKHQEAVIAFNHTSQLEEEQTLLEETQKQNAEKFGAVALPVQRIITPIAQAQAANSTKQLPEAFDTPAATPSKKAKKQAAKLQEQLSKQSAEELDTAAAAPSKKAKKQAAKSQAQLSKQSAEELDTAAPAPAKKMNKQAVKPQAQASKQTKEELDTAAAAPAKKMNKHPVQPLAQTSNSTQPSDAAASAQKPAKVTMQPITHTPRAHTPRKIKRARKKKMVHKKQIRKKKPTLQKKRVVRRRRAVNHKKKYVKKKKRIVVYQTKK